MILYELVCGDSPFADCSSIEQLTDRVCFENEIPLPSHLSAPIQGLLSAMLRFDPRARPPVDHVKSLLAELRGVCY